MRGSAGGGGVGLRKIVRGGVRAGEKNPGLYCNLLNNPFIIDRVGDANLYWSEPHLAMYP